MSHRAPDTGIQWGTRFLGRRCTVERVEGGLAIDIARVPLWIAATSTLFPSLMVGAAFLAFVLESRSAPTFVYPTILLLGLAFREARHWWRSADALLLLDKGVLQRADWATGPSRAQVSLALGPDATARANGSVSGWALQDLIGICAEPRVSVRSAGLELEFGVGLREDEARELVETLVASPAFRASSESPSPPVAPVVRVKGALGGRGVSASPSAKQVALAVQPDRLWPLRRAKGMSDVGVILAFGLLLVWMYVAMDAGPEATTPLAVVCLFAVIPALLRMSRTLFSGTYTAQVIGTPARPGEEVTLRFGLDRHAPVFEWIDIRLQYIRVIKREDGWFGKTFRYELTRDVVCEGHYALPADRLPPGPDEHVDARFALPGDAPPTPGGKKAQERWRLEVIGRTPHGAFAEEFRVIVLPPDPIPPPSPGLRPRRFR